MKEEKMRGFLCLILVLFYPNQFFMESEHCTCYRVSELEYYKLTQEKIDFDIFKFFYSEIE